MYFCIVLVIDNTRISEALFKTEFACNLKACKGACCVAGASGAPLENDEAELLRKHFPKFKPYMVKKGIEAVKKQGYAVYDSDGDLTTPLVGPEKECAYVYFESDQTAKCAIEKAYEEGHIDWIKPISCHLYPIRIDTQNNIELVKYSKWSVCAPACKNGSQLGLPLYKFLKMPLIRKYGKAWYKQLEDIAKTFLKSKH